jgi:hypothetical protein
MCFQASETAYISEPVKRVTTQVPRPLFSEQQQSRMGDIAQLLERDKKYRETVTERARERPANNISLVRQRRAVAQNQPPVQASRKADLGNQGIEADNFEETPAKKMARLSDTIKKLESEAKYDELIRAWVEYGACVRMEHSDAHPLLVRTHFSMATTYLRQKLVVQALQHFKAAEEINSCNDFDKDKEAANFRCRCVILSGWACAGLTGARQDLGGHGHLRDAAGPLPHGARAPAQGQARLPQAQAGESRRKRGGGG